MTHDKGGVSYSAFCCHISAFQMVALFLTFVGFSVFSKGDGWAFFDVLFVDWDDCDF